MINIFTQPSEMGVPVDDQDLDKLEDNALNKDSQRFLTKTTNKGSDILTAEGANMSKFNLKQFIMEVLADPAVGQRFKSKPAMPITMSSGKNVEILSVSGPEDDKIITFSIDDGHGGSYTIQRRWSDILGNGNEWFEPVTEAVKVGSYGGKSYKASPGSVSAIKKSGDSAKKAVGAGKFDWATDPYAAAQAAHIVATGEPTVKKGTKRKKASESDTYEGKQCEQCGLAYEGSRCSECGY